MIIASCIARCDHFENVLFDNSIVKILRVITRMNSIRCYVNSQRVKHNVSRETTTRNDVIQMNENTNNTNDATTTNDVANVANDVVTNANANDATSLTLTKTRATTRALRDVTIAKNAKTKTIRDDENHEIVIVRTSTNALRIDHTTCYENNVHANDKNARSKCRASIARANDKKSKK